jgi:multisubunit Na+/H+ antiporter MnhE subunit
MSAPNGPVLKAGDTFRRSAVLCCGWWVAMFAAWVALVDTIAWPEIILGAGAATVATGVGFTVQRRGYIRFRPRARWLLQTPRLAWAVLADSALLAGALWRRVVGREVVEGVTIRVPFDYGGDNGRDGARRALVNLSVSLTPNSFVIDIDPEAESLLVHQLVARPLDFVLATQRSRAQARGIGVDT